LEPKEPSNRANKISTAQKSQPSTPKKKEHGGGGGGGGGGADEEERVDEVVQDEKIPDTQQLNASTETKDRLSEYVNQ